MGLDARIILFDCALTPSSIVCVCACSTEFSVSIIEGAYTVKSLPRILRNQSCERMIERKQHQKKMNNLVFEQNNKLATEISLRNAEQERMERETWQKAENSTSK